MANRKALIRNGSIEVEVVTPAPSEYYQVRWVGPRGGEERATVHAADVKFLEDAPAEEPAADVRTSDLGTAGGEQD